MAPAHVVHGMMPACVVCSMALTCVMHGMMPTHVMCSVMPACVMHSVTPTHVMCGTMPACVMYGAALTLLCAAWHPYVSCMAPACITCVMHSSTWGCSL